MQFGQFGGQCIKACGTNPNQLSAFALAVTERHSGLFAPNPKTSKLYTEYIASSAQGLIAHLFWNPFHIKLICVSKLMEIFHLVSFGVTPNGVRRRQTILFAFRLHYGCGLYSLTGVLLLSIMYDFYCILEINCKMRGKMYLLTLYTKRQCNCEKCKYIYCKRSLYYYTYYTTRQKQ